MMVYDGGEGWLIGVVGSDIVDGDYDFGFDLGWVGVLVWLVG